MVEIDSEVKAGQRPNGRFSNPISSERCPVFNHLTDFKQIYTKSCGLVSSCEPLSPNSLAHPTSEIRVADTKHWNALRVECPRMVL